MPEVGGTRSVSLPQEVVDQLEELAGKHYGGDIGRTVAALLLGNVTVTTQIEGASLSTLAARQKEAARTRRRSGDATSSRTTKKSTTKSATKKKAVSKKSTSKKSTAEKESTPKKPTRRKATAKKSTAKKAKNGKTSRRSSGGIPGKGGFGRRR
jgi:cytoskeletal protein RodZ